jgi:hypothetical protein
MRAQKPRMWGRLERDCDRRGLPSVVSRQSTSACSAHGRRSCQEGQQRRVNNGSHQQKSQQPANNQMGRSMSPRRNAENCSCPGFMAVTRETCAIAPLMGHIP